VFLSQRSLDAAAHAFRHDDCATAIDRGLDSIETLPVRPEPYRIVGLCDVRLGEPTLAMRAMRSAVHRDPREWRYRYGLAIAQGAAGIDPRPEAARALRLNPHNRLARDLARRVATSSPRDWRSAARSAPVRL